MKILIGKYQGTIYPETNGYTGSIDLGFDGRGNRIRVKRRGRTKAIVRERLAQVVADRDAGIKTSDGYRSERPPATGSRRGPEILARAPLRRTGFSSRSTSCQKSAPSS